MMITPPIAAAQAGQASGGGLLDSFKNAVGGATGAATTQTAPKGDGSVGLFDGVLKKALFGGAAGAAMGFIPFIPGGPVLGGIVGALGGAALGVFTNWSTMKKIKQENEAMLAALGVQSQDPQIKQILQSGDVGQLIPLMQQDPAQGTAVQQGTTQTDPGQQEAALAAQQQAIQQGQLPATVDPAATAQQSPIPIQATTGQIAVGSGAGAVNPGVGVDPGQAPGTVSQGGGGVTEASAGVDALDPDTAKLTKAQVVELLQKLERQLNDLKAFLAEEERREELDKAAAR